MADMGMGHGTMGYGASMDCALRIRIANGCRTWDVDGKPLDLSKGGENCAR
jgi:hypothetical protein